MLFDSQHVVCSNGTAVNQLQKEPKPCLKMKPHDDNSSKPLEQERRWLQPESFLL